MNVIAILLQKKFALAGVAVAAIDVIVAATRAAPDEETIPPLGVPVLESAQTLVQPLDAGSEQPTGLTLSMTRQSRFVWPAPGPITTYFGLGHPTGIDIGLDP